MNRSMLDTTPPRLVGTVLLVSQDAIASHHVTDAMQELALSVEVCVSVPAAADRLSRRKVEAVVIDLAFGDQATVCLEQLRASASNKTAVRFALTSSSQETAHALNQGFSFVLQRPLTPESVGHTLKVAYGQIVRERRRYFRYPVAVPIAFSRESAPEVYGQTINISERGVSLRTSSPLSPGTEGTTHFTLPGVPVGIRAESRVCWNNEKGEAGLSFLFLPFDLASELQAWLAQKLEQQLPQRVAERFSQTRGS
jgi:DNA-binding NarL/FixJ family response regulator